MPQPKNALAPEPKNSLWSAFKQYVADAMPGGALNREWSPERVEAVKFGLSFTPIVGDAISGYDAVQAARRGNYGEAALNAAGALPFIPSIAGALGKSNLPETMRVFHGGATKVTAPDFGKSGSVSGLAEEGRTFWVTPSESSAKRFGEMASKTPVISEFGFTPKNPMIAEYPIQTIIDGSFGKFKLDALNKAKKAGHDSVVFRQAGKGEKLLDDEIAVFDPSILKHTPR